MDARKKTQYVKHAAILSAYIFILWGLYRFLFKLPDEIEELIIKPLLWLVPVYLLVRKEGGGAKSVGITSKNLFPSIYLALGLGALFVIEAVFINYLKYGGFEFTANIGTMPILASLGLSFVTAFTEEVTFRGYIFNRFWFATGREWMANITTSIIWALVHVPVAFFVWKLSFGAALVYLFLTTIFGIGSAFLFARTKNVFSSTILHVMWEWPIILFR